MIKLPFRRAPTYAEIIERRLAEAEISLLDAESEFERAKADRDRLADGVARLKRERGPLHVSRQPAHPPRPVRSAQEQS